MKTKDEIKNQIKSKLIEKIQSLEGMDINQIRPILIANDVYYRIKTISPNILEYRFGDINGILTLKTK